MTQPRNVQSSKPAGDSSPLTKGGLGGAGYAGGHRAFGAGLTVAVSVTCFAYLGLWIDEGAGTKPWLTLLLVLFGLVGGFLHLIHAVAPELLPKKKSARPRAQHPPSDHPANRP